MEFCEILLRRQRKLATCCLASRLCHIRCPFAPLFRLAHLCLSFGERRASSAVLGPLPLAITNHDCFFASLLKKQKNHTSFCKEFWNWAHWTPRPAPSIQCPILPSFPARKATLQSSHNVFLFGIVHSRMSSDISPSFSANFRWV